MTAVINTADDLETLTVIGETLRPLLTNEMGSSIEIYDTQGHEGMGPPPHVHDWSESYVVLEGEIDLIVDGREQRIGAGMSAHAPGGSTHGYRIAADNTHFLTVLSAGNGLPFFRNMDAEVSFPPDIEDVVRVAGSHGISFCL